MDSPYEAENGMDVPARGAPCMVEDLTQDNEGPNVTKAGTSVEPKTNLNRNRLDVQVDSGLDSFR